MENRKDSENYRDCLEIRPGMKREFAMMMNQSQFIGSIGRTRSSRPSGGGVIENETVKKTESLKRCRVGELDEEKLVKNDQASEDEEMKSDIVDLTSEDERKSGSKVEMEELEETKIENAIVDVKSPCQGDSGNVIGGNVFSLRRVTRSVTKSVKEVAVGVEMLPTKSDIVDLMSEDEKKSDLKDETKELEETKIENTVGGALNASVDVKSPCQGDSGDVIGMFSLRRITRSVSKSVNEEAKEVVESKVVSSTAVGKVDMEMSEKIGLEKLPTKSNIVDLMSEDEKKSDSKDELKESKETKIVNSEAQKASVVDVKSPCQGDSGSVLGGNVFSLRRITRSVSKSVNEEVKEVVESKVVSSMALGKLDMEMSEKIGVEKLRTPKLKDLLETGLLEGSAVKYLRGPKGRYGTDNGLAGIIRGAGILCFCDVCNGAKVLTPNQFELHAGSANKRPPEYIYLENGSTLRDVMNACKDVPWDAMEVVIQYAIGRSTEKPILCQECKGLLPDSGDGRSRLLCGSCMLLKESQPSTPQQGDTSESLNLLRPRLLASTLKSTDRKAYCSSSRSKGQGRVTRKDLRMHKLGLEALAEGAEVAYFARGKKLLVGYKKGLAIFCFCCQTEVSPSTFEAHAGYASRRKPYLHIYTSNGVSLHELAVKTSLTRDFSAEENDDLCSICLDGGDLLLCDTCPRSFHHVCVSLPVIPDGKFHCKYCKNTFEKEKFVEHNENAVAAGRVDGVDPIEEIHKRCIRIVGTVEAADIGGCVLCRGHDFSKSGFGPQTVIICDQCEKEYHVGCLKEHNMDDLEELPTGKWFCSTKCNGIHTALQKLVADGEAILSDTLLDVIKKKHVEKEGSQDSANLDIKWRLLCGKMASESDETRVLLAKAISIFHEQFDPIANSGTRQDDFIPHMVYGRNSRDQDFGGMYCAILTVNSSVVSAGVFRIFGQEVAELPLVATSTTCQRLGYFQSLFSCIQNLLGSLDVKNLVLPAADEAESIWTKKFGFEKMTQEQLKTYRRDHQMMVFQGTSMLQKPIPNKALGE